MPTSANCWWSRLIEFAAHSEDASRPQPQEHLTSQAATGYSITGATMGSSVELGWPLDSRPGRRACAAGLAGPA